ncbi:MAG: hypothetical protein HYZ42_16905, partial [Bacteroidetes bacterium]|nr:hypothetical protein [Bacteroidota bacterium]
MNPYKIITCCFVIYFHFGKSKSIYAQSYNFESYTVENGLSQNSIYDLHIDKEGFLWVATGDGLNRYDGYNFEKYNGLKQDSCSLKNNFIRRIEETPLGNFILQTDQGIEYFDKRKKCFKNLLNIDQMRYLGLSSVMIGGDDSLVWAFGTAGFVLKINVAKLTYQKIKLNLKSFGLYSYHGLKKVDDNLLMLLESSLNVYDCKSGKLTKVYDRNSRIKCNLSKVGNEVFFTDNNYLVSYNLRSHKIVKKLIQGFDASQSYYVFMKNANEGYTTNKLNEIVYFKNNKVVDIIKNNVVNYRSLTSNFLSVILLDENENLWVGSDGGGIQKSNKLLNNISHYTLNENRLNNKVMVKSFAEIDSIHILVGTFGYGVFILNTSTEEYIRPKNNNDFSSEDVYSLCRLGSKVLLGTQSGLLWYDIKENKLKKTEHCNQHACVRHIDHYQNKLYISCDSGFFITDELLKNVTRKYGPEDGQYVYTMHDSKGALWRTNVYNGIWYENQQKIIKIGTKNGLQNESVRCVVEDRNGDYWAATEGGLAYIQFDGSNKPKIRNYTEDDGLVNSYVYSVILTKENNLWLSTNMGLSFFDTKSKKFTNYNQKDGLQSNEYNTGAYILLPNNTLCFGGVNGFNIIKDEFRIKETKPSPIVVTNFQAGSKIYTNIQNGDLLQLDHTSNHIIVNFAYLNFTNVNKNVFT